MSDADAHAVTMTLREWQYVDAVMDNTASMAAVNGRRQQESLARSIRQAGWDQVQGTDKVWPDKGVQTRVSLPFASWRFVTQQLDHWAEIEADVEEHGGEHLRSLCDLIRSQLPASPS